MGKRALLVHKHRLALGALEQHRRRGPAFLRKRFQFDREKFRLAQKHGGNVQQRESPAAPSQPRCKRLEALALGNERNHDARQRGRGRRLCVPAAIRAGARRVAASVEFAPAPERAFVTLAAAEAVMPVRAARGVGAGAAAACRAAGVIPAGIRIVGGRLARPGRNKCQVKSCYVFIIGHVFKFRPCEQGGAPGIRVNPITILFGRRYQARTAAFRAEITPCSQCRKRVSAASPSASSSSAGAVGRSLVGRSLVSVIRIVRGPGRVLRRIIFGGRRRLFGRALPHDLGAQIARGPAELSDRAPERPRDCRHAFGPEQEQDRYCHNRRFARRHSKKR